MSRFGFQRLEVYQLSKALVMKCYQLTNRFPQEEKFALVQQINKAAISIPSNIVEGYGRMTAKDKRHFLNVAYSSLMELVCQFEIADALGYLPKSALTDVLDHVFILSIKIGNFRNSISGSEVKNG